jgi:1,2-diacylglycerol 3-alpha-glucosyltransferase
MILYHHCSPHQVCLVTTAQNRFQSAGHQLFAVEFYGGLADYNWSFRDKARPADWLCLFPDTKAVSTWQLFQQIKRLVKQHQIEVLVINGWYDRITWLLAATKKLLGCKLVIVSDSVAWDFARDWHKELLKSCLVSSMDAGFAAGAPQREYLASLGLHPDRITLGNDAVDNDLYYPIEHPPVEKSRVIHLGTAARLIESKNHLTALCALASFNRAHPEYSLCWHLAGTGPLEDAITGKAKELQLNVQLHGFVGYHDMPKFYEKLDLYWQPSQREPWGLVVNEAMAAGLPVLVSQRCGCAMDLVRPGVGWTHAVDEASMIEAWEIAFSQLSQWREMGERARQLIRQWDSRRYAEGLLEACQIAASER